MGGNDSTTGHAEGLVEVVLEELLALRGAHGKLTVEKFSRYPHLRRVCGDSDELVAFLVFERELQRYVRKGNRNEVAAALSIAAPWETVLDRLTEVTQHLDPDGDGRDQRTARRWSDQGMRVLATELVHLADVQIRLGSELTSIELSGKYEDGVIVDIFRLTASHPEERAPLVKIWHYLPDATGEQNNTIEYDLDEMKSAEGSKGPFRLRFHAFRLDTLRGLDQAPVSAGTTVYRFSVEGRDAPLRAVSFQDESNLADFFRVRFTAHLTDATVEMVKRASDPLLP